MSASASANVIPFEYRAGTFRLERQLEKVGVEHRIVSSRIDGARTPRALVVVMMPLSQDAGITDDQLRSVLSRVRLVVYNGHVYRVRLEEALVAEGGHRPSPAPDYYYVRFGIVEGQ